MTHYICRWLLTLQFLEKQAGLLVNILEKSIYEVEVEDHFNIPRGFWDKGVPVDDVNLETGDDQPHNTTMGSQDNDTFAFDFQINQLLSWNQAHHWFLVLVESSMWGLTVNQNQKKDYIRKQLQNNTSSIYKTSTHFYNLPQNFGTGLLMRGCTYQKKLCIPGSLSLSLLHWKREWEERLAGVGPWSGPTTQLPSIDTMPSHWTWCPL